MTKRKTIGLLIHDLDGNYQVRLWNSIKKASEEYDCNLVIYEGRTLACKYDADKQHHIMYDFVDKNRVDGLIITANTIGNYIDRNRIIEFCMKYRDIPTVSLGAVVPNATSMVFDNKEGMKSLVRHMVEDHGYRKIVFVTGPENNVDAIERFEAFKEIMKDNNIPLDENMIFHGDFLYRTGYSIMERILQNGIEYDAVVCSNDDMALAAVQCIKDYKDIKGSFDYIKKMTICGFDDSINSDRIKPALTTVRQPLEEMGQGAVETILNILDGGKVKDVLKYPSVVVKRESCGCRYENDLHDISMNLERVIPSYRAHENVQTYSLEELLDRVTHSVERCHIRSFFISKYVQGTILYDESLVFDSTFTVPDKSELIYAYCDNHRINIGDDIKFYDTTRIIPECFIPKERRITYLVNPLFFRNEHFGFVCFEIVNNELINFEPIRGQISNTLKVALMLNEREKMEECLREAESLAMLGQLIGGLSHNLMTPIMALAGVSAGLEDLAREFKESIDDPSVTREDYHEIVGEMMDWINKMREYNAYMSNVIRTVKTQAAQMNSDSVNGFTIEELVNRVKFLKNNDVKIKTTNINFDIDVDQTTTIQGDISNLIQVINNIFINAVESYEGVECSNCSIELGISRNEDGIIFSIKDYGKGIRSDIRTKIFKHMVTTKGRHGTGLSLLLSYSTIKGKYGGNIWFESDEDKGTTFYITIPV